MFLACPKELHNVFVLAMMEMQEVGEWPEEKYLINSFTSHSAKSKIDTFSKITNCVKLKNKQPHS